MARILSRTDVQRCLTMVEAISVMRTAFSALHTGQAQISPRMAIPLSEQNLALLMPSLLQTTEEDALGLKIITVVPQNSLRHLPRIHASILLLDVVTGETLAIMEGSWLTIMRTGATSGVATDVLAQQDAAVLALFGAGAQAPGQVLAIDAVRPLREVRVVNRSDEHFQQLVAVLQQALGSACPAIYRASSAKEALMGASVVACATAATTPLFHWEDIAPGTHINAIGAFTPEMCEVDAETLAHARIVVDQREAALAEAGDLLQPLARGLIRGPEAWIELGGLLNGVVSGRQSDREVTIFKSVGVAMQDVAIALYVYRRAREMNVGMEVNI